MLDVPGQPDLADLVLALASCEDDELDQVVTDTLRSLAVAGGADRGFVTFFHGDGTFSNSHEWTPETVVPHRPVIQAVPVSDYEYSSNLAQRGEVLAVQSLDELPEEAGPERRSFGSFGVHGLLQVPVHYGGSVIAVVGFNTLEPTGAWPPDFIDTVARVGSAIGVALHRRRTAERAAQALELARRAARAKNTLIETASHELRTPLHAVLGYAELLGLDGIDHPALDAIRTNGTNLLVMIDDLLELTQVASDIDQGAVNPSLDQVVAEVVANLGPVAQGRAVSLSVQQPDQAVEADPIAQPIQVRKVIHCVVSAAMASAGSGGAITVITSSSSPTPSLLVTVTGPDAQPPTGLALALAQALLDDRGGRCIVTARPDGASLLVQLGY